MSHTHPTPPWMLGPHVWESRGQLVSEFLAVLTFRYSVLPAVTLMPARAEECPALPLTAALTGLRCWAPWQAVLCRSPRSQHSARIFRFSRWIPRRACASSEGLTESFQVAEDMKLFSSWGLPHCVRKQGGYRQSHWCHEVTATGRGADGVAGVTVGTAELQGSQEPEWRGRWGKAGWRWPFASWKDKWHLKHCREGNKFII